MASALADALRQAADLQKQTWKAYEPIYAALGYSEFPPEHVVRAVVKGVEDAARALGSDQERIKLFRARKAIEENRAAIVPVEDRCEFCDERLGAADENGVRECPECESRFDKSGELARQG